MSGFIPVFEYPGGYPVNPSTIGESVLRFIEERGGETVQEPLKTGAQLPNGGGRVTGGVRTTRDGVQTIQYF